MVVVICDECHYKYKIFINEYSISVCPKCNSKNKTLRKIYTNEIITRSK